MISGLKENYLRQSVTGLLFPGSLKNSAKFNFFLLIYCQRTSHQDQRLFYTSFTCSYIFYLDCTHLWKLPSVFLLFQSLPVFTLHKNSGKYKKNQVNIKQQKEAISSLEATRVSGLCQRRASQTQLVARVPHKSGIPGLGNLGLWDREQFYTLWTFPMCIFRPFSVLKRHVHWSHFKVFIAGAEAGVDNLVPGQKVNFCSEFIQQGHGNQIMGNWGQVENIDENGYFVLLPLYISVLSNAASKGQWLKYCRCSYS